VLVGVSGVTCSNVASSLLGLCVVGAELLSLGFGVFNLILVCFILLLMF